MRLRPRSNGRSRSASCTRYSRCRRCAQARAQRDAKAMVGAIVATNLDYVVGKVQWNGANLPPFAAKNVAKTPLVGGQWRVKDGISTTSSSPTIELPRTFRPAAKWRRIG